MKIPSCEVREDFKYSLTSCSIFSRSAPDFTVHCFDIGAMGWAVGAAVAWVGRGEVEEGPSAGACEVVGAGGVVGAFA